ncbi:hypothetical protein QFZ65_001078 [Arthrobacter sp. B3I9]|nr:hypothetical protein [Arthrobacter sp. B3I9]
MIQVSTESDAGRTATADAGSTSEFTTHPDQSALACFPREREAQTPIGSRGRTAMALRTTVEQAGEGLR